MSTTIALNGEEYELALTIGSLKGLGLIPNNLENNLDKMTDILSGLLTGDPFTLLNTLKILLKKDNVKPEEIEAALAEDGTPELFDKVETFFETSPLTKVMAAKIVPALKQHLSKLDEVEVSD